MDPLLNEAEQALRDRAREVAEQAIAPLAAHIDADAAIPGDALAAIVEEGLTGPVPGTEDVPALLQMALVLEELARASAAVGARVAAQWVVGQALTGAPGQEDLRQRVVGGATRAAYAGGHGARVTATPDADNWRLDGEAALVTGVSDSELLVVAARQVVDGEPGKRELFAVETGQAGVEIGATGRLLGLHGCSVSEVGLGGVVVPSSRRVDSATAYRRAQTARRIADAAIGLGIAAAALEACVAHVAQRREAGDRLDRSQAVQWHVADIVTEAEAARVSTWSAAVEGDLQARHRAAAGARLLSAESAVHASRRALQVLGARASVQGSVVERLYRDAKMLEIHEGTNEEQLRVIARHLVPDLVGSDDPEA